MKTLLLAALTLISFNAFSSVGCQTLREAWDDQSKMTKLKKRHIVKKYHKGSNETLRWFFSVKEIEMSGKDVLVTADCSIADISEPLTREYKYIFIIRLKADKKFINQLLNVRKNGSWIADIKIRKTTNTLIFSYWDWTGKGNHKLSAQKVEIDADLINIPKI